LDKYHRATLPTSKQRQTTDADPEEPLPTHREWPVCLLSVLIPVMLMAAITHWVYCNAQELITNVEQETEGMAPQIGRYAMRDVSGTQVTFHLFARGSPLLSRVVLAQSGLVVLLFCTLTACWLTLVPEAQHLDGTVIGYLSTYMNGFLPFFFALYINTNFSRWWAMRTQGLGSIYKSCDENCMLMATFCPGENFQPQREALISWCLALHALVFQLARNEQDLQLLVQNQLLTAEECQELERGSGCKARLVWKWILDMWNDLHKDAAIDWWVLQDAIRSINEGRQGVQVCFTFLTCQIPYRWLHLMSSIISLNAFILAVKCSIICAKMIGDIEEHETCQFNLATGLTCHDEAIDNFVRVMSQVIQVSVTPFVHLAFMEFATDLANPFERDVTDFPESVYTKNLAAQLKGYFEVGKGSRLTGSRLTAKKK